MIDDEDYAYEQKRQRKLDCTTCESLGKVSRCNKGSLCECAARNIGEACENSNSIPCPVCSGVRGINVAEGMKDEDGNELAPDWSSIIAYICGQGYPRAQVARLLDCDRTRVYNMQAGISQPSYKQGLLLVKLYELVKGD